MIELEENARQHYKVQLDIFEGPLDLLLYLIKKEEVGIHEISIERITRHYMEFINTFKILNIELASEFIVMAANLMYLKSRALLPKSQQPPEEDVDEEDPRWELIRQLVEYKKFKDAAEFLGQREAEQSDWFPVHPEPTKVEQPREDNPLPEDVGVFDLIRAFQKVLKRFEDEHTLAEIVDDRFTVADKIDWLLTTIPPGGKARFSSLFARASTRNEVIVTFMAMLELIKLNQVRVHQTELLGDIELIRSQSA